LERIYPSKTRLNPNITLPWPCCARRLRSAPRHCGRTTPLSTPSGMWHTMLYFTHLYLQPREEDFATWNDEPDELHDLGKPVEEGLIFSREQILAYLDFCLEHVECRWTPWTCQRNRASIGFPLTSWTCSSTTAGMSCLHTGDLFERLGAHGEVEMAWVGMKG